MKRDLGLEDQYDLEFDAKDTESDLTLKEFQAEVQAKYHLQGSVTLYHRDKRLTDMMAHLDTILEPWDTLVMVTDKRVAVASGGVGKGATAVSEVGAVATAKGGYGSGGSYKKKQDRSLLRGGRGLGGDGDGGSGSAGEGYGGTAASHRRHVDNVAGRGTGGQFTASEI